MSAPNSPEIRIQLPDLDVPDDDHNIAGSSSSPTPSFSLSSPASSPLPIPDTSLLSPTTASRLDVPYPNSSASSAADSASIHDGSSISIPPSPTLSFRSSVHFEPKSTLALRDNHPNARSGGDSYALLSPGSMAQATENLHRRKGSTATDNSFASSNTETGTDPDSHSPRGTNELSQIKTNTTEVTHIPSRNHSRESSALRKGKGRAFSDDDTAKDNEDGLKAQVELIEDEDMNPAPFAFTPLTLARLLDPKSYESLASLGGVNGLIQGLGVDQTRGLLTGVSRSNHDPHKQVHYADSGRTEVAKQGVGGDKLGAGEGASHRHPPLTPAIVLTQPDAKEGEGDIVKAGSTPSLNSSKEKDPMQGEAFDPRNFDAAGAFQSSLDKRREIYGSNTLPMRKSKSLLALMAAAMKDKVLILLSIAAVVSLALGFFQDFGTPRAPDAGPKVDWVEGVAIVVAILIVVIVGSLNDWQKERQFKSLNDKKEERGVKVIRSGVEKVIDIKEVVVGDIALLEPGEIVPCDGVFLSGHNCRCDESGATGESDAIRKVSWDDWSALRKKHAEDKDVHNSELAHVDSFVVSGSKVLEGVGRYVVIAVGQKSFNGRIMMALRGDSENTPLQLKLNDLAELIAKLGSAAGLILFTALMIRFFVQLGTGEPVRSASEKGIAFVNILIISVTLIVVAVPEGLPLAVTIALAFATKRMTKEKLLVRVLGSCETMANATVVCTDKTGTLTQNDMTVVAGSVGIHAKFVRTLKENEGRSNAKEQPSRAAVEAVPATRKHIHDFSLDQSQLNTILSPALQQLFNEAVAVNSTAFQDIDPNTGELAFVGSKTETAFLKFASELGWQDYRKTRTAYGLSAGDEESENESKEGRAGSRGEVLQMIPFSSERKSMGVVVSTRGRFRFYVKGASEILSKKCTRHIIVGRPGQDRPVSEDDLIETREIDELAADNISRTIIFYANQMLRTISVCYRDFEQWPPVGMKVDEEGEVDFNDLAQDLTLVAIAGLEDPLRKGVREAVAKCHRAGVVVKMCTGDNVLTARSIASQCGIFTKGGIIMEGPVFRKLSQPEMIDIAPRLQVLARSSPEDKKVLVETLKHIGDLVGVTGDGTNDGPALKTANVGFSMGIAGTEVAKEASDIILMDDNFASIVKAIMWGRCVNDAVRKFLQFQLSTNVTAVVITFVSAVASNEEESVLSAVQLLWINIIMDTFAALALATDPASEALLNRKPERKNAPLFSVDMYKQILFQSTYQIIITLILHFLGLQVLGIESSTTNNTIVQTMVFNTFVFAQIFNSVNSRRLDRKLNIFEGVMNNWYFIGITLIEIVVQVLIVFVGGSAFQVARVDGKVWGISLALGFVSIPLGALIRLLPNEPFENLFNKLGLFGKSSDILPSSMPDQEGWHGAISLVRDNLSTFSHVRGGRLRSSSFVVKSRSARLSRDQEPLRISSLLTMAPTLIAGAVATHGYTQRGTLSDPTSNDPSKSSAALWEGKLQLHPDTSRDDPAYTRFGGDQNIL
ncbi:Ca-transporting ATPase [Lentinula aciculospora]|uniref:Calcium-transporting ATPase n=1 Tax=Lentinula aciculospora TaxID=153920 RepID=A0A9W9DPL9_9AGAR|nr:Ca-transporting ATPase [Lentinula aciculospora]